jgi:hypothetical protein
LGFLIIDCWFLPQIIARIFLGWRKTSHIFFAIKFWNWLEKDEEIFPKKTFSEKQDRITHTHNDGVCYQKSNEIQMEDYNY